MHDGGRAFGPVRIKIDQNIVQDQRQGLGLFLVLFDKSQPDADQQLFPGAAAQLIDPPGAVIFVKDKQAGVFQ